MIDYINLVWHIKNVDKGRQETPIFLSRLYSLLRRKSVSLQWPSTSYSGKVKGKANSLDIAPLTILDSGALQPRKWQLTDIDCSTAAQAVAAHSPR